MMVCKIHQQISTVTCDLGFLPTANPGIICDPKIGLITKIKLQSVTTCIVDENLNIIHNNGKDY